MSSVPSRCAATVGAAVGGGSLSVPAPRPLAVALTGPAFGVAALPLPFAFAAPFLSALSVFLADLAAFGFAASPFVAVLFAAVALAAALFTGPVFAAVPALAATLLDLAALALVAAALVAAAFGAVLLALAVPLAVLARDAVVRAAAVRVAGRTVRAVPADRVDGVEATVAADIALAASVSDFTATSIALVAVLIACRAVVMVFADEVALVAAVLSFVAAVVTLVAAADTVLGVAAEAARDAAVPDVRVVPDVLLACEPVARAVDARDAARVPVAVGLAVLGLAVAGFAAVVRAVARLPVSVGTDLFPPIVIRYGESHSTHAKFYTSLS